MPAFGDDVVAVVEELGLGDVVLIGHSMGGDVVAEAALDLGGKVRGLVWVDVYGTLGEPRDPEALRAFVAPFREDFAASTDALVRRMFGSTADADLVEWVAADMASAPEEIALDAMWHARGNEGRVVEILPKLPAPVVAINADPESTATEGLSRHGIRVVFQPGVGHFPMMEDADAFNRLLTEVVGSFRR
jgi:pimeloyl-ACP methyl ester carboxylesterase